MSAGSDTNSGGGRKNWVSKIFFFFSIVVVPFQTWLVRVSEQINLMFFGKHHQILWDRAAVINVDLVDQRFDLY
jgi:hypothetical protein